MKNVLKELLRSFSAACLFSVRSGSVGLTLVHAKSQDALDHDKGQKSAIWEFSPLDFGRFLQIFLDFWCYL